MAMSLGTRDDRVLALTGLAALPLDPVEILTQPVLDAELGLHLATLGPGPGGLRGDARPRLTELAWPAADPRFASRCWAASATSIRTGATTRRDSRRRPEFWRFFAEHPLP